MIHINCLVGKIGNIRWINSDTRYPDWVNKRWLGWTMRRGHWGRCAFFAPAASELEVSDG